MNIVRLINKNLFSVDVRCLKSIYTFIPRKDAIPLTVGLEQAQRIELEDFPGHLVLAILLHEDSLFFVHRGFHWAEMKRRLARYIFGEGERASGSSISQQLAKVVFPGRTTGSIPGKIREAFLTVELEGTFSKEQILSLYLNSIPLGKPAVYGMRSAARRYFKKEPRELSLDESFFLASIIPAPFRSLRRYLSEEGEPRYDYRYEFEKYCALFRIYYAAFGPLSLEAPHDVSARQTIEIMKKFRNLAAFPVSDDALSAIESRAIRHLLQLRIVLRELRARKSEFGRIPEDELQWLTADTRLQTANQDASRSS